MKKLLAVGANLFIESLTMMELLGSAGQELSQAFDISPNYLRLQNPENLMELVLTSYLSILVDTKHS